MHLPATFSIEARFLISLIITVAVETTVIICCIRFLFKITSLQLPLRRCLFAGFFASFATLPYLWFVLPAFVHPYPLLVTAGELGVFTVEAVAYIFLLDLPFRKTAVLSFTANLASIFVGLLVLPPF
jgi:hypothetical protein